MADGQLVAFLLVALVVTVTPGADMALVTRHALGGGRTAAWAASSGVVTGLVVWTALAAVGVAALLSASAVAFTTLKIAGAIYLILLGIQALRSAGRLIAEPGDHVHESGSRLVQSGRAYRQGLLSNLLNPKIGVFYTSLLPQFVATDGNVALQSLALGLIQVGIVAVWLLGYSVLVVRAGRILRRRRVRLWLDRVTGVVLIGFGLRLATTVRR